MFHGALWAGVGRLFSMCSSFLATLVIARAVVPADYGIYFVALTTSMIMAGVGTLGLDQVVVRFSATPMSLGDKAGVRHVVGLCLGIVTISALVVSAVFLLFGRWAFTSVLGMPGLAVYSGMMAAWILSSTLQRQLTETFRGLNDIRMATLFGGLRTGGILNAAIICVVMVSLWASGHLTLFTSLLTMLAASVTVVAIAATTLWMRLRGTDPGSRPRLAPPPALGFKTAIHEGWPLGLAGFIVILNNLGSAWLASPLDTASHVALLGVAQRVMQLLIAPMSVVNAILPPIIAELHGAAKLQRLEYVIKSIGGLLLVPSLLLLGLLVVAGRPLLHLFFGAYYEAAYPVLILLCAGQTINIATGAWQIVLPMTGSKHQLLTSSVIAVCTQFGLGLALGYRMGVLGVAIGYCASIIITNIAGMLLVHRKLGIWTYASLNWHTFREAFEMIMARVTRKLAWQRQ